MLDLDGPTIRALPPGTPTRLLLSSSTGRLEEGWSGPNEDAGGWRISLEFDPAGAAVADLRCTLLAGDDPVARAVSETWVHRWRA